MPNLTLKKRRPVWYNLSPLALPLPGWASIFHRISGVVLFFGLFWLLYLLDTSLQSPESFERYKAAVSHPLAKLVLLGIIWAYLHHIFAGIRYLMHDLHVGDQLPAARKSAGAVFIVSLALTAIIGVAIW
ncbi:MAG: succinate dehydrogenase, cytochrome b556 subunit [Betaproteobacteria bacterium RIFCSPLOWO2_12_FULL_62_13b]|nr:MAG: succinate dehydrogenase, cytochrome b556 subunit [Betaproteobacteria bacterium RIFCSPLOWO2_12_FULL_62_13b]